MDGISVAKVDPFPNKSFLVIVENATIFFFEKFTPGNSEHSIVIVKSSRK